MATARDDKPYEGGEGLGTGGKFRKRPYKRTHTTPYDRPPTALRNPSGSTGWLSKIVDPAQKLISSGAQKIFSTVFRKRLPPPPTPILHPAPSTPRQPPSPKSSSQELNHEESRKLVEPVGTDVSGKEETVIGQIKCQTSPDGSYFSEIEKLLKQKTFTRSEIDSLTALLRSRTVETSIGDEVKRPAANSLKPDFSNNRKDKLPEKTALENGVGNHQVSCQITGPMALDNDFGSPASLAKAYMASNPSKASLTLLGLQNQSHLKDLSSLSYQSTPASSASMTVFPWNSTHIGNVENGLTTAKYQGRSSMYKMAQMPYSRENPSSTLKAQKRRSSALENDIGSVGPLRRIRHKPNLLSSRGLSLQVSGSTLSMMGARSGTAVTRSPMKQPVLHDEAKDVFHTKRLTEKIDDTNTTPNRSLPPSSKSSEMASKILQQLDKIVPSKDKLSEFKVPNLSDNSPKKLSPSMLRGQDLRSLEHMESSRFLEAHRDISKVEKSIDNSSPSSLNMHALKQDKVDNGPSKLIVPFGVPASSQKNALSVFLGESSAVKPAVLPQIKRALHMSAHEDFLDVDDDSSTNGTASSLSSKGKDIMNTEPVADRKAIDSRLNIQEKSSSLDGKSKYGNPEGSLFVESRKISASELGYSSLTGESKLLSTSVSEKVASQNHSDAVLHTSPLPCRGNGVESTLEQEASIPISGGDKFDFSGEPAAEVSNIVSQKCVHSEQVPCTPSSIGESILIFKGDKFISSQEPAALSPNNFSNKNVDSSQVKFSTPSKGVEITTFAGANSDSKPAIVTSSSTAAMAGPNDSTPKVPEINKADGKANSFPGLFGRLSEATSGTAATASAPLTSSGIFSFSSTMNSNSDPINGSLRTSAPFSSSFPSVPIGNVAGTTSSSTSNIISAVTPVFNHSAHVSSNSVPASTGNLSTSVSEPPFAAPSFPKFVASAFSTASDKPVSATSNNSMFAASTNSAGTSTQGTVLGSLSGTMFGGSSFSSGSAGSGIFGFNSSSVSSAGNQSQSLTFGAQASAATDFPTLTQSMPSSASSGYANNSGSSLFSASSPTSIFSSASSFSFNATTASSEANSVGSSSAPSWQPSKSTTSFTSPPSMFTFGSSATSVAPTSTPSTSVTTPIFSFGAGTALATPSASSGALFPFTSTPATTSTQPVFNSLGPAFQFGSPAPPNNSEMNMEDSMAEDGVQGSTTTAPPAFPPQSVAPVSNFAVSSSTNPPGVGNPFQFGGQQNFSASQNPSPFQPSASLDFSGGGSFSLGSGGVDKSNRRIVKVNRNRQRKK